AVRRRVLVAILEPRPRDLPAGFAGTGTTGRSRRRELPDGNRAGIEAEGVATRRPGTAEVGRCDGRTTRPLELQVLRRRVAALEAALRGGRRVAAGEGARAAGREGGRGGGRRRFAGPRAVTRPTRARCAGGGERVGRAVQTGSVTGFDGIARAVPGAG